MREIYASGEVLPKEVPHLDQTVIDGLLQAEISGVSNPELPVMEVVASIKPRNELLFTGVGPEYTSGYGFVADRLYVGKIFTYAAAYFSAKKNGRMIPVVNKSDIERAGTDDSWDTSKLPLPPILAQELKSFLYAAEMMLNEPGLIVALSRLASNVFPFEPNSDSADSHVSRQTHNKLTQMIVRQGAASVYRPLAFASDRMTKELFTPPTLPLPLFFDTSFEIGAASAIETNKLDRSVAAFMSTVPARPVRKPLWQKSRK